MTEKELLNYLTNETLASSIWEDTDSGYFAEFDLPGFNKSEIEIKAKSNILLIKAKASESSKKRQALNFDLSYRFPASADLSKTQADLNLGVLKVSVPKKDSEKPKEISIKVS